MVKVLIYFLASIVHGQLNRERGQCFNLIPPEIKIVNQTSWGSGNTWGGKLFVTLELAGYVDDILESRRAGIVNDRTFFEIGVTARGDFGRQTQLKLGKPRLPLNKAQEAGNFFQYDVDDQFTTELSMQKRITMQLNFRFLQKVKNVKFEVQSVIMCDGGYFETINYEIPGLPENCAASTIDQMKWTYLGRDNSTGLNRGKFETKVKSSSKIGCDGYVLLGFDAGAKFISFEPPVKQIVATDKQFDACNGSNGECRGIYQRVNLHTSEPDIQVGESRQVAISGIFSFQGTETHMPVGLMQFHCDFGHQCQSIEVSTESSTSEITTTATTELTTTTQLTTSTPASSTPSTQSTQTIQTSTLSTSDSILSTLNFNLTDLMDHLVVLDKNMQRLRAGDLVNYGCSSFSLQRRPKSLTSRSGLPVDTVDGALRKWHNCRKCAVVDASQNGFSCDTHYNFDVFYRRCGKYN